MPDINRSYQRINLLTGWVVFIIASIVYLLCVEPTASWWDCGEYIATSYKLQVGHPPGAPLFQMIGRFFSLFAFGNLSRVALMVNIMSALSSSFTILFLFFSITLLAKKIVLKSGDLNAGRIYAIMGAGFVGAMAYTFTDSFWFSAEEGEVYAMSSLCTAVVFWTILKWESLENEKGSYQWIIFIGFIIGLSIGVHLLNLLAIPAIAFVFYFKKYKATRKGIIITGLFSVIILGFVMNFLIPWIVKMAGMFELFSVNSLGLPFNSGTVIYFLLMLTGIIWGLRITHRKQKILAHTVILILTFIIIGYSSFIMLVVRSNADTPLDENNPDDAIGLLSYLQREQYGDWPILYGQYYNAPVVSYTDGSPLYKRDNLTHKYIVTDDRKQTIPVYDPKLCGFFPRMWSNQKQSHITAYKQWGGTGGIPVSVTKSNGETETIVKPSFGQNLRFFFTYQVGHMYFRYFMWNFSGRQNDIEGYGGYDDGNWISGISFIDNSRLGTQDNLPESMNNAAKNKFYMLPLILGLIGLVYQFKKTYKDGLVVGLLFFMTGLAIILYLNQTPYQPRERDYSYAGSFYAFAIWIGLGVLALWEYLAKKLNPAVTAFAVTLICTLLVPAIMAKEGWNDHTRAGKYACRDYAFAYLNSCAPNAILITNGDNDTFPLWYAQEVENVRTDVRVLNFMLASGDWYIHQLSRKMYNSDPLPFTLSQDKYDKGVNDYIPFYDEKINGYTDIRDIINFINSDDQQTKLALQSGKKINYIPTKNLRITVDSALVLKNGIVPPGLASHIVPVIQWKMKKNYLFKNDLMLLDFLATSNWSRPLYFVSPSSVNDFLDIDKYCHLEGMVYRFMPVIADNYVRTMGGISYDKNCYDLLMNKSQWGNLNKPGVYVDRESYRNAGIPKSSFLRLAQLLVTEHKNDSAIKVIDRCQEIFPNEKIPYDLYMYPFVEVYYRAGAFEKGNKMAAILLKIFTEDITYYSLQKPKIAQYYESDKNQAVALVQSIGQLAAEYKQEKVLRTVDAYFASNPQLLKK